MRTGLRPLGRRARGGSPEGETAAGGEAAAGARGRPTTAPYFIRSAILASAARAHSSSIWPPGAPLTPIAPIAAPPAMMVTPPTA